MCANLVISGRASRRLLATVLCFGVLLTAAVAGGTDRDADGVLGLYDLCSKTPAGVEVDKYGCARVQVDVDGDDLCNKRLPTIRTGRKKGRRAVTKPEWCTGHDNCDKVYNPLQTRTRSSRLGDACNRKGCHKACRTGCDPLEAGLDGVARNSILVCTTPGLPGALLHDKRCKSPYLPLVDSDFGCYLPGEESGSETGGDGTGDGTGGDGGSSTTTTSGSGGGGGDGSNNNNNNDNGSTDVNDDAGNDDDDDGSEDNDDDPDVDDDAVDEIVTNGGGGSTTTTIGSGNGNGNDAGGDDELDTGSEDGSSADYDNDDADNVASNSGTGASNGITHTEVTSDVSNDAANQASSSSSSSTVMIVGATVGGVAVAVALATALFVHRRRHIAARLHVLPSASPRKASKPTQDDTQVDDVIKLGAVSELWDTGVNTLTAGQVAHVVGSEDDSARPSVFVNGVATDGAHAAAAVAAGGSAAVVVDPQDVDVVSGMNDVIFQQKQALRPKRVRRNSNSNNSKKKQQPIAAGVVVKNKNKPAKEAHAVAEGEDSTSPLAEQQAPVQTAAMVPQEQESYAI